MAEKKDPEFVVVPKHGDKKTVFDFRGSDYESNQILIVDFGDGASTSVSISDDGHWHVSYRYGTDGDYQITTKYAGKVGDEVNDTAKVKVG